MSFYNTEDFAPSLREALAKTEGSPLDLDKTIRAAVPVQDPVPGEPYKPAADLPREFLHLVAGEGHCAWQVESLRSLFRGDTPAPVMGAYPPEEYDFSFVIFDVHIHEFSSVFGCPRDAELLEIFSVIRRRPDGRSLGFLHNYLWQATAVMLGIKPLSEAEFTAIVARMERSCRTFMEGSTSRNFAESIQMRFDSVK